MRHVVKLPKLGDTTTEVVLLEWLVVVGQTVAVGDPVALVETDKTTAEVPSPVAGTVDGLLATVDDELALGAALLSIATA